MSTRPRVGLAGKFLLGTAGAAILPLAAALAATLIAFSAQSGALAGEIAMEKARSASLLLSAKAERIVIALRRAAEENSLVVNLELGLEQPVKAYLEGLRSAVGASGIEILDPEGALVAAAGFITASVPEAPADGGDSVRLTTMSRSLAIIAESPIASKGWKGRGRIVCSADFAALAAGLAEELGTELLAAVPGGPPVVLGLPAGRASFLNDVPPGFTEIAAAGRTMQGNGCVFASFPFPPGQSPASASVIVAYDPAATDGVKDAGVTAFFVACAVALALSVAVCASIARRISRPALVLAAAARQISSGAYGLRTGIELDDEIGDLAREFDAMSTALAAGAERSQAAEEALRISEARFRAFFDGVSEAIFIHDPETGRIIDFNASAEAIYGIDRSDPASVRISNLSDSEAGYDDAAALALIRRAAGGERVRAEWRTRGVAGGPATWSEVSLRKAAVDGREVVIVSVRDIGERKSFELALEKSLHERDALIQEVHHRVKNNFQIVDSLLDMQAKAVPDEALARVLMEPKSRIHAMALVHERLYQSGNLSSLDLGGYLSELAVDVHGAYADPRAGKVALEVEMDEVAAKPDLAIPLGLILNELLTNSMKYAFAGRGGRLRVSLKASGGVLRLLVSDDGQGFPGGAVPSAGATLGLSLINALVAQIKGSIDFRSPPGVEALIEAPIPPDRGPILTPIITINQH